MKHRTRAAAETEFGGGGGRRSTRKRKKRRGKVLPWSSNAASVFVSTLFILILISL